MNILLLLFINYIVASGFTGNNNNMNNDYKLVNPAIPNGSNINNPHGLELLNLVRSKLDEQDKENPLMGILNVYEHLYASIKAHWDLEANLTLSGNIKNKAKETIDRLNEKEHLSEEESKELTKQIQIYNTFSKCEQLLVECINKTYSEAMKSTKYAVCNRNIRQKGC
ncbi:hypothetical protein NEOKW01_0886 [Nematocida sp. AWRm80]|nr:hypothetical protein NEOKW01_0886 [Nematocida sp. AWRm80]